MDRSDCSFILQIGAHDIYNRANFLLGASGAIIAAGTAGAGATTLLRSTVPRPKIAPGLAVPRQPVIPLTLSLMRAAGASRISDPYTQTTYYANGETFPYHPRYVRMNNGTVVPLDNLCPLGHTVEPLDQNCCENDCDTGDYTYIGYVSGNSGGTLIQPTPQDPPPLQDGWWDVVNVPYFDIPVIVAGPTYMTPKQGFTCGKAAAEAIAGAYAFANAIISRANKLPAYIVETAEAALKKWEPTGLAASAAFEFFGAMIAGVTAGEFLALCTIVGGVFVTVGGVYEIIDCLQ